MVCTAVDLRPGEAVAHLGHVMDRPEESALDLAQMLGQAREVGAGEHGFAIVVRAAPIGWSEVERRVRSVIAADEAISSPCRMPGF